MVQVDFEKLAAQMPKITAMLEQNDSNLIKVPPLDIYFVG